MISKLLDALNKGTNLHPKVIEKEIQYGTAGFRTKASDLDSVVFRMGLVAALRSMSVNGSAIGVMITASHNPEEDNGLKLIDPMGEMLEPNWEKSATLLANVSDEEVPATLEKIVKEYYIGLSEKSVVYVACDTRPSSPALVKAVLDGTKALNAEVKDFGFLSTPQLHYIVRCTNTNKKYGEPNEEGYFTKLCTAFKNLCLKAPVEGEYMPKVLIDGANGIGANKAKLLKDYVKDHLEIELYNDGSSGKLNYLCGADYVKINQKPPEGLNASSHDRCLSFDGDADRIIYFYLNGDKTFHMLDGDKISALTMKFLQNLLKNTGLSLDVVVVQTAYANGNSTKYIEQELKVPVAFVPTGVKHLHHRAQQADIGVYFEANGHGTVVFSDNAINQISELANGSNVFSSGPQNEAAKTLLDVIDVINQTVGDAISDMLLVETVLRFNKWSIKNWDDMYHDLPNRQVKVTVKDRNVISTTDAERKCLTPAGLQETIDELVNGYKDGRAFVRPSGTEDIVRIYAEAATQAEADALARAVSKSVFELAGGIGMQP